MTLHDALELLLGDQPDTVVVDGYDLHFYGNSGTKVIVRSEGASRRDKLAQLFQHEQHRASVAEAAARRGSK